MRSRIGLVAAWVLISLCSLRAAAQATRPAQPPDPKPTMRDDFRAPWEPATGQFIKRWLVCADFPNPPRDGAKLYDFSYPSQGLSTDWFESIGGESAARPVEGAAVKRPDGTEARWLLVQTKDRSYDLRKSLGDRPSTNVTAYAYASLDADADGPVILSLAHDHAAKAWLNGQLVYESAADNPFRYDSVLIPVTLKKGGNALLMKVVNGTGALGVAARVLSGAATDALPPTARLGKADGENVIVECDAALYANRPARATVKLEAIAAGGAVLETRPASRGDAITLKSGAWPQGAYEIRCVWTGTDGTRYVQHLPYYKGDALAAARRLVETRATADRATQPGLVHGTLADMVLDRLGGSLPERPTTRQVAALNSPLMEFEELALQAQGKPAGVRPWGFVRLAYRDDIDDAPQFCRAYLPPDYDPTRKYPLVVFLHGYHPENPPYVRWWSVDRRHNDMVDRYGVILIEPHGRGNTGYSGIGERDVLRCIEMASKQFSVDPARVCLTGESMGGGGAWLVGSRNAHLFAGVAPTYGGWDWRVHTSPDEARAWQPWELFSAEARSSLAQADCLLTTPVYINQGDADELVSVEYMRHASRLLNRWGFDVRYWEHPGIGHTNLGQYDALYQWFIERRLEANPSRVRLRAPGLDAARAHWLRVERADSRRMIVAQAQITAPNKICVDSDNALRIALTPAGALIDPARPVAVTWNGVELPAATLRNGAIVLDSPDYRPAPLEKTPCREGPIGTVMATPFAIVEGTTSSDPLMRTYVHARALALAHFWESWQKARPRMFTDTAITPADIEAYSLILVGGADANAVTARLADKLPLKVDASKVTIDGRTFDAPDACVQVVYPHPTNPARYVTVIAATSGRGMYYADQIDDQFDFAIEDGRMRVGRGEHQALWLAAGWFDRRWKLADSLLVTGDEPARTAAARRKVPTHVKADAPEASMALSDVLELSAQGVFLGMSRDVSMAGKPLSLAGKPFASGIATGYWRAVHSADFDLAGGWKRLRATVGLELDADLTEAQRNAISLRFVVEGDGKELYRSASFKADTAPANIDVDVTGIKTLTLRLVGDGGANMSARSADWADLRLER